ncbi:hypothetical protein L596_012033 [Steinernema carpocapsae]|uniref:G-protein coupled receptors family 1 profile domain-containing protein n=1 Tax=Steinernema carpocapsae TaxID=34508 RepID=A0A4U5NWH7_STECR|nr:hypothetical protein L596_012033 [Steinernema carpocapsae]
MADDAGYTMCVTEIVFGCFSALSLLAQVILIVVILRKKDLRTGSFYMLNVALSFTDIGTITTHYVFQRFPQMGLFTDSFYLFFGKYNTFAEICTNGFSFLKALQKYYLIAIGLNRFTAIVFPFVHQFWTTSNTLILIFVIAISASVPHITISALTRSFYADLNSSLHCNMDNEDIFQIHLSYMIYQPAGAAVILVLANAFIFSVLGASRRKMKDATGVNKKRYIVEAKLAFVIAIHVILLLGDSIIGVYTFVKMKDEMMIFIYIIQDILCGINPYLLLLFSSEIRRQVIFCHRKENHVVVVISTLSANSKIHPTSSKI